MRNLGLLLSLLLSVITTFAQASPSQNTTSGNSASSAAPVTLDGCLTSMNGSVNLATQSGLLLLKGDHDTLLRHNGQQVRVTGTMTSGKNKPRGLKVDKIKKLADTCQ